MNTNPVPVHFDWVKARAECSIYQMFKKLEMGVRTDVDTRNTQIDRRQHDVKFSVVAGRGNKFSVVREEWRDMGIPVAAAIDFVFSNDAISVSMEDKVMLSIKVALGDTGRCMCRIEDQEVEEWQIRRRALEPLFFQPLAVS